MQSCCLAVWRYPLPSFTADRYCRPDTSCTGLILLLGRSIKLPTGDCTAACRLVSDREIACQLGHGLAVILKITNNDPFFNYGYTGADLGNVIQVMT